MTEIYITFRHRIFIYFLFSRARWHLFLCVRTRKRNYSVDVTEFSSGRILLRDQTKIRLKERKKSCRRFLDGRVCSWLPQLSFNIVKCSVEYFRLWTTKNIVTSRSNFHSVPRLGLRTNWNLFPCALRIHLKFPLSIQSGDSERRYFPYRLEWVLTF